MNHQGVLALPLVKVKEKFQITLPAELREVLHVAVGDLLEATIQDNVIVLKPKVVVDRAQAWAKIGSSPSLRPGLSPCTIGQYPSFPVVFISQSKGPALNQLDFVVEALSHAVGIAMPNVAHNRFKPPA